jgi:hypothetical protein
MKYMIEYQIRTAVLPVVDVADNVAIGTASLAWTRKALKG